MQNPHDPDPDALAHLRAHIDDATALLEAIVEDRGLLAFVDPELRERLLIAAGQVARPTAKDRRRLNRAHRRKEKVEKRAEQRALLDKTRIRQLRDNPIFLTPKRITEQGDDPSVTAPEARSEPIGHVDEPRTCYVCRDKYTAIHWFYDQMCIRCGDFNHRKRTQVGDLSGRVAMITGARVKIGYQAAIFLLRSGAHVIITTRFPQDAAKRYAAEDDFDDWAHRLEIHGIDLRHVPSVEALCDQISATHDRLDLLIHNACQTVRRPPGFYDHLMDGELGTTQLTDREAGLVRASPVQTGNVAAFPAAALSQVPLVHGDDERGETLFPAGSFDADLQQVDLRTVNSWRLKLAEVPTVELLEVHLVNAIAPFIINGRLRPLMAATPGQDKHIVNVSAMEGQFYRTFKSDRHPHTNMAKAALNMMTRTASMDYIEDGIHMNSVDTGWVTDEDPAHHAASKKEMHDFHPPLDIVDGAARIVDPYFSGLNTGEHVWGQFLRNYRITDW